MRLTATQLTAAENAIFGALEYGADAPTFVGRLYRDGVPTPEAYLAERTRVLFVFREPNMRGRAYPLDMRDEVRDPHFRPLTKDGTRKERSPKCWWNWKAGMFAHAVAAAIQDKPWEEAFSRFRAGGWNHEVVNRFAYVQIKKIGGGGTSNADEICSHAAKYATTLKQQIDLYRPHLVLGCGVGRDSPARLVATHVLPGGKKAVTDRTKAPWWEFAPTSRPRALVRLWHPARRGLRSELYQDVWISVHEVVHKLGLGSALSTG